MVLTRLGYKPDMGTELSKVPVEMSCSRTGAGGVRGRCSPEKWALLSAVPVGLERSQAAVWALCLMYSGLDPTRAEWSFPWCWLGCLKALLFEVGTAWSRLSRPRCIRLGLRLVLTERTWRSEWLMFLVLALPGFLPLWTNDVTGAKCIELFAILELPQIFGSYL